MIVATVAALIAGCGGGGSPDEAVTDIFAAGADQDYAAVCELLTDEAQQQAIEENDAETCEEAQEAELADAPPEFFEEVEVGEATEDGDSATVEFSVLGQTDEVALLKEDGDWKINE